jgi:hypothetical protein
MKGLKLPDGRDRLVRHGHGPERTIQTGIGPVEVERVKIRDRAAVRFTSAILPLWGRKRRNGYDSANSILYDGLVHPGAVGDERNGIRSQG